MLISIHLTQTVCSSQKISIPKAASARSKANSYLVLPGCAGLWGCVQRIPPRVQKSGLESAMGVRRGLGCSALDASIALQFPLIFFVLRKGRIKCFKQISHWKSFYFSSVGGVGGNQWKIRKTRTSVPSPVEEGAVTAAAAHPWGSFPSAAGAVRLCSLPWESQQCPQPAEKQQCKTRKKLQYRDKADENLGEKRQFKSNLKPLLLCSHQGEEIPNVSHAVICTVITSNGKQGKHCCQILLEKQHCGMSGVWITAFWDKQALLVF